MKKNPGMHVLAPLLAVTFLIFGWSNPIARSAARSRPGIVRVTGGPPCLFPCALGNGLQISVINQPCGPAHFTVVISGGRAGRPVPPSEIPPLQEIPPFHSVEEDVSGHSVPFFFDPFSD